MARPGSGTNGDRLYRDLARHNRLISWLRIIVPILGLLILVILVAQIWIANMGVDVSVGGLSLARGTLTIEAPHFSGTTRDGQAYVLTARTAQTQLGDTGHSDLADLTLKLEGKNGYRLSAMAGKARLTLASQIVQVSGPMDFTDSDGDKGRLLDPLIDWPNQTITSTKPVRITFGTGAVIDAAGMRYDANKGRWVFDKVTLTLPPGTQGTTP